MDFEEFFRQAYGRTDRSFGPFDYQKELAEKEHWPDLLEVPTGMGKTAAVVLGWLYKRWNRDPSTPRRLVYCLPMRVLVEQTHENAIGWLERMGWLAGTAKWKQPEKKLGLVEYASDPQADGIAVHVLMGGEERTDWDLHPEKSAILIGTQDMLLSRVLNRGYGMSRYRWPMHFGLLNSDCLWVFDEVQLMGAGLATSVQLQAFRNSLGVMSPVRSLWMSATLDRSWLRTVDLDPGSIEDPVRLATADKVRSLTYSAKKPVQRASGTVGDVKTLAEAIVSAHMPGSRTLVIVNTVDRALDLFRQLDKKKPAAEIVLVHSRFRPRDRARKIEKLLSTPGPEGTIVVSTQVVEAGVDVSARTLFTELAPWASLVQRFGRCNRHGEYGETESAQVYWLDLPDDERRHDALSRPYESGQLIEARQFLRRCEQGVGPNALESIDAKLEFRHGQVIRSKDLVELFDTTPDLAGNDIDIDRFVRDVDDSDVQVFWREIAGVPDAAEPLPGRNELCRAPIGSFRAFVQKLDKAGRSRVYRRSFLERKWETVFSSQVYAGQVYMISADAGGYSRAMGWTGEVSKPGSEVVQVLPVENGRFSDDSNDAEPYSQIGIWQSLAEHSNQAYAELNALLDEMNLPDGESREALLIAIRWHDLGKAHRVFRAALPENEPPDNMPDLFEIYAKAKGRWKRYMRPGFRHELASALAVVQDRSGQIPECSRSLISYLVAAHHGKVRLSIRSLPNERKPPDPDIRFARGVWDGDELPEVDLGGGVTAAATTLSLLPMELGFSAEDQPSWSERMLTLRDQPELGPFRLAWMEAVLRVADMRVSMRAAVEEEK